MVYTWLRPGQQSRCVGDSSQSSEDNNNNNNNRIQRRYSRFFTISSQRRELSPTRTLKWPRRNRAQIIIMCNTSSAFHVQHVVLRATWYEGTAQLLSLTELKSHLFELYFVGWIIKPDAGGEETGVPGENPWRRASENATYYSPKIQAPSETRTREVALVAG